MKGMSGKANVYYSSTRCNKSRATHADGQLHGPAEVEPDDLSISNQKQLINKTFEINCGKFELP